MLLLPLSTVSCSSADSGNASYGIPVEGSQGKDPGTRTRLNQTKAQLKCFCAQFDYLRLFSLNDISRLASGASGASDPRTNGVEHQAKPIMCGWNGGSQPEGKQFVKK